VTRLDPRLRALATGLRNDATMPEVVLWSRLRASRLGFKFRRQTVIAPFIVDFFCPAIGLVIEVDGRTHRGEADAIRDAALAAKGFKVLRFSNADIALDIEQVLRTIDMTARHLPPRFGFRPSAPSVEGEGAR
jgi:very-short-patch-repair endonuclease